MEGKLNNEEVNEIMREVDKKFEELKIAQTINCFLELESTEKVMKKGHEILVRLVKEQVDNAVPEVKEVADSMYQTVVENYEPFRLDVINNFKLRLIYTIDALVMFGGKLITTELLINSITYNNYEKPNQDIIDICSEVATKISGDIRMQIYNNYVPDGVPEEVIDFIKTFFCDGAIIPAEALFPEIFDEKEMREKGTAEE